MQEAAAEDESPLSRSERSLFGPIVYNAAVFAMNGGFLVAFLAAAYLLYGLFSGASADFNTLTHADRLRVLGNIGAASHLLTYSFGVAALATAYVLWGEDFVGYGILIAALVVGLGIPQIYGMLSGDKAPTAATREALRAFPSGMLFPLVIGAVLVAIDIVQRLSNSVRNRPLKTEKMTYGRGAAAESRPVRTSLLAKCWEGPYCREFIRVHCPIFIARKACWREKRGCYCEEDIVSAAAAKVTGIVLDMAPDPKMNFANAPAPITPAAAKHTVAYDPLASGTPMQSIGGGGMGQLDSGLAGALNIAPTPPRKIELTAAQKRERCRNCVIYNEHQREKYKLLMPATILGAIALCAVISAHLRALIGWALAMVDALLGRISFTGNGAPAPMQFSHPSETVEWLLVAAITLMVVSKALQFLEWAVFKAKV